LTYRARVAGVGRYVPERVMTNTELEKMVQTSDQWIQERTGIRERRIAAPHETASTMGVEAAREAIACSRVTPGEIDLVVTATCTPDGMFPAVSSRIQHAIGAPRAAAFDVNAACSGFLSALGVATQFIASGQSRKALVVGSETMSRIVDWSDRGTCVLFGDGAGAAVIRPAAGDGRGVLSTFTRSDGTLAELLYRPAGGARIPLDLAVLDERAHFVRMAGPEVFKAAVRAMCEAAEQALRRAGVRSEEIDLLVPHQANVRIIESTARYSTLSGEDTLSAHVRFWKPHARVNGAHSPVSHIRRYELTVDEPMAVNAGRCASSPPMACWAVVLIP
jgi:3-oxoacyl-[acyl-carrier-protein] synthase III